MDGLEISETERAHIHDKLLDYFISIHMANKRGICCPGLSLTETEVGALLRLTRARAPAHT